MPPQHRRNMHLGDRDIACARLARTLEIERRRLDLARAMNHALMVAADDGWPPGHSAESIEDAIRGLEAAMAVAGCDFAAAGGLPM